MGMHGLFKADLVEWMTSMTYQAASGAGAEHMRELVKQMGFAHEAARPMLEDPACTILDLDGAVTSALRDRSFPSEQFGFPLAGSLLAWIDKAIAGALSRGLRTGDIMQPNMRKVGTAEMGDAVVAALL